MASYLQTELSNQLRHPEQQQQSPVLPVCPSDFKRSCLTLAGSPSWTAEVDGGGINK